jgi:hypothetical protein
MSYYALSGEVRLRIEYSIFSNHFLKLESYYEYMLQGLNGDDDDDTRDV